MGLLVVKVAVRQVLLVLRFSPVSIIPPVIQGACKMLLHTSRVNTSNPNRRNGSFKHRPVSGNERFLSLIERLTKQKYPNYVIIHSQLT
jgi:hypothetical protein